MVFKKEFETKFCCKSFVDWCKVNFTINCKEELKEVLKYYFEENCTETNYNILMDYITEITDKVWEEFYQKEIPMEESIKDTIINNKAFEDLIQGIMDKYYSQGFQIEKIENQIASACIAKINQISWQKAINALKN